MFLNVELWNTWALQHMFLYTRAFSARVDAEGHVVGRYGQVMLLWAGQRFRINRMRP